MALEGEDIVSAGSRDDVERSAGRGAEVVELPGAVLPGFIDAHQHYAMAALDLGAPDLRFPPGSRLTELLDRVRSAVEAEPRDTWIRLFGYEPADFLERRAPHARELDAICPTRPVFLQSATIHEGVLNSAGLAALGWDRGAIDPEGGWIVRSRGRPTGEVIENAAFIAEAVSRDEALKTGAEAWLEACERHGRAMLAHGVTRVADAAVPASFERLYARAAAEGKLPLTVHAMPAGSTTILEPRFDGEPTGGGPALSPVGPAKLFVDGGHRCAVCLSLAQTATAGAAVLRNVVAGAGISVLRAAVREGQPRLGRDAHLHRGVSFWEQAQLDRTIRHAATRGFQVAQHAMGNTASEAAVLALERAVEDVHEAPGRPRLEHLVFVSRGIARRIAGVGAVGVVQPGIIPAYGDDPLLRSLSDSIGMLPLRSLREAGVELAGSSDYPVAPASVLLAVQAAATRRTRSGATVGADEGISVEEALRAYTVGSAKALGVEDRVGTVTPGKRADLVALSGDPLAVDVDRINELRVTHTWVGGRLAYTNSEAP
ncbi:MAG: amidohydrolase [Gaiellaceae bacterium]